MKVRSGVTVGKIIGKYYKKEHVDGISAARYLLLCTMADHDSSDSRK
jgi:hypothetical protein